MTFQAGALDKGKFSPTITGAGSPDSEHPTVSLRYLRKSHCISKCEKNDRAAFAVRMLKLTQMSWAEIKQADRHGLGMEKIAQLDGKLPDEAPFNTPAIALRFSGKKPMVGFRQDQVFHVVWFDRNFDLYDHS